MLSKAQQHNARRLPEEGQKHEGSMKNANNMCYALELFDDRRE